MIYIFIVDTSVSMNRIFSNGLSYLECAKAGIEQFFKWEQKRSDRQNNKYLLVTYEEYPRCYRAGFGDTEKQVLAALKLVKAHDLSNPGQALHAAFSYVNTYRLQAAMDEPGAGRYVGGSETTIMFLMTDNARFTSPKGVTDRLEVPGLQRPAGEFYIEPFRWDQRLYTLFMVPQSSSVDPQLQGMSADMYGESWKISSLTHMLQCIDNCMGASKPVPHPVEPQTHIAINQGVVIALEEIPTDAPENQPRLPPSKAIIYADSRASRIFPIPESYAPKLIDKSPPPRRAHPTVHFIRKADEKFSIFERFPVDRFSMDQSNPVIQELSTKKPGTSWPLFVISSSEPGAPGPPFGFLKVGASQKFVNLYILPYNFQALFSLLDHRAKLLKRNPNATPSSAWRQHMREYMDKIPSYYIPPLRIAFRLLGIDSLMSDLPEPTPLMMNYVSAVRAQAKIEYEKLLKLTSPETKENPKEAASFTLLNPFDVSKPELRSKLKALRNQFLENPAADLQSKKATDDERLHSLPIAQMGDYAARMSKRQLLRDPFEDDDEARFREQTMFGNPYRRDKKVSIDEADEASVESSERMSFVSTSSTSSLARRGKRRHLNDTEMQEFEQLRQRRLERIPTWESITDTALPLPRGNLRRDYVQMLGENAKRRSESIAIDGASTLAKIEPATDLDLQSRYEASQLSRTHSWDSRPSIVAVENDGPDGRFPYPVYGVTSPTTSTPTSYAATSVSVPPTQAHLYLPQANSTPALTPGYPAACGFAPQAPQALQAPQQQQLPPQSQQQLQQLQTQQQQSLHAPDLDISVSSSPLTPAGLLGQQPLVNLPLLSSTPLSGVFPPAPQHALSNLNLSNLAPEFVAAAVSMLSGGTGLFAPTQVLEPNGGAPSAPVQYPAMPGLMPLQSEQPRTSSEGSGIPRDPRLQKRQAQQNPLAQPVQFVQQSHLMQLTQLSQLSQPSQPAQQSQFIQQQPQQPQQAPAPVALPLGAVVGPVDMSSFGGMAPAISGAAAVPFLVPNGDGGRTAMDMLGSFQHQIGTQPMPQPGSAALYQDRQTQGPLVPPHTAAQAGMQPLQYGGGGGFKRGYPKRARGDEPSDRRPGNPERPHKQRPGLGAGGGGHRGAGSGAQGAGSPSGHYGPLHRAHP
ncbi:uncharacterized protein BJ171DRAFT_154456 [Polychytrium aggregatum]|uniref:uncharacterized protein n=1 Tax=Polychytrium aggregatum TaxID=110093 RepID=UPI0022FE8E2B|nr:uncharacterized protein BJ171DRAFT_154456 [Polychytrium aggregatum]KAI9203185.1 hypothetical protein BJ171DRAFT_154456 [Polychytrium aggregatum]